MHERPMYIAGEGPLTYARVLREALGMFRQHYWRVALVAFVLFVPPPVAATALRGVRESLASEPGLARGVGYLIGLLMVALFQLLGPVVYAGYLDEAVGHEYFRGRRLRFAAVIRTLPWGRLLMADILLVVGAVIGLAFFVLPGLAWMTLFGLVGPVIVQERHGVIDGFRRTFRLCLRAWPMVLVLVVGFFAVELVIHELVHELFHGSDFWLQVAASWLVSVVIGGVVGLIEVALGTELMARNPLRSPASDLSG